MAQVANNDTLTADGIERFITRFVERDGTILITDQNPGYRQVGRILQWQTPAPGGN